MDSGNMRRYWRKILAQLTNKPEGKPNDQSVSKPAGVVVTYVPFVPFIPTGGGYWGGAQVGNGGAPGGSVHGAGGAVGAGGGASPGITFHVGGVVRDGEFDGKKRALEDGGLLIQPLRGSRSFTVDATGHLLGVSFGYVWEPGENTARCLKFDGSAPLIVPVLSPVLWSGPRAVKDAEWRGAHEIDECRHGFYGYYDGSNDFYRPGMVSGVIEGFGECVVGTRGFRASKARIVALHVPYGVPTDLAALVRRNYAGIPLFESFEAMVAEFPPDNPDD